MRRISALVLVLVSQLLNPADAQLSEIAPRPKVALVLSGGSAYGLAHIGVIKVLEEMGIPVDIVVGTSMGAIIGGFYAMGYNADELRHIVEETDWLDLFDEDTESDAESFMYMTDRSRYAAALRFDKKGFTIGTGYLTGHKMLRFIDSISLSVPSNVNFDDLPRKFRAVATDISNGERVVLSDGSLADAMRSSSSVPGVFAPYFLNGRYLVDGCIVDNLPIDLARSMGADIVIAVDLFNGTPFDPEIDNRSPISSLSRSYDILVYANVQRQLARANLVIPVDMTGYATSDFEKSGEIMEVGEQSARKRIKELSAISVQEKLDPGYEADFPKHIAVSPPIKKIIVAGASEKRSEQIQKLFEPLIGTVPDLVALQTVFQKIDRSGNKNTVRIKRDFTQSDRPLVITLTEKKRDENLLRVNFSYEASFSKALVSDLDLVPALSFPGLTTIDSRLLIDVELFDAPSFDIRFIQPLNPSLYISPFLAYIQEFDTKITAKNGAYQTRTVSQTVGLRLVMQPTYGFELNVGWSYDWIGDLIFRELNGEAPIEYLSVIRAGLDIYRVDSQIFPMNGILASVDALLTRPEIGSTLSFATIETRGSVFSSFNTPVSVGLLWKAGTVFAADTDGTDSVPSFYKPDLSGRRMFPGPLNIEERIGNHVAGLGFELKFNPNRDSPGIAFPFFILLHGAIGVVINDVHALDRISDVYHWNSTAGVGIKITNAFGVAFRGGILQRTDKSFIPFIALDIGSIAYK